MSDEAFDWYGDPSVCIKEQLAVAVFVNEAGELAITQAADAWTQEEHLITVALANVPALIDAILAAAGLEPVDIALDDVEQEQDTARTKGKDSTAAARQRRYRERKQRDGDRDGGVTPDRNGVTRNGGDRDAVTDRNADRNADRDVTPSRTVTRNADRDAAE